MADNEQLTISRQTLITLALEVWRISRTLEQKEDQTNVALRYSLRKLRQVLSSEGISFIDLTGRPYDAGMAIDIIDTEGSAQNSDDTLYIKEMIAPIILYQDSLLASGQAILERKQNSTKDQA